jgi:hypothetical protein
MVGGAAGAFVSRRLRAAQTGTLREHRIDPSSVPAGRIFATGRHHSIFQPARFWLPPSPSWYQKSSIRSNARNNLLLAQRAVHVQAI